MHGVSPFFLSTGEPDGIGLTPVPWAPEGAALARRMSHSSRWVEQGQAALGRVQSLVGVAGALGRGVLARCRLTTGNLPPCSGTAAVQMGTERGVARAHIVLYGSECKQN